jgi:hypothetical protein
MNGALPPSSSETFFTVVGALRHQQLADSVEPVNENLRTSGFWVISAPMRARIGVAVTTLNTPFGQAGAVGQLRQRQRGERRLSPA